VKRALGALGAVTLVFAPAGAAACPCRGSAGPSAPLTATTERFGVALSQSTEIVHGTWDAWGELHEHGEEESNRLVDYSLLVAYRPFAELETALQLSYANQTVVAPGLAAETSGLGDTVLRARYELFDQPMPMRKSPLPGVAAALAVRAPTGRDEGAAPRGVASGTTGSLGSSAASTSLGAWELTLGLELVKSLGVHWEAAAYGEAAFRFPDDSLGVERRLGPRALGQLSARFIPVPDLSLGAFADVGWEDEVTIDEEVVGGTAQRRVSLGAFASWRLSPSGLSGGMQVRHTPLADSLSANVLASTSLSVSLGFAR
jgi:hypothetical protein